MRAKERMIVAHVKAMDLAIQYGKETMDMRPLISLLSGNCQHTVPANWKAKNAKARPAAVKTEPGKK